MKSTFNRMDVNDYDFYLIEVYCKNKRNKISPQSGRGNLRRLAGPLHRHLH